MLSAIILKNTGWIINIQKRAKEILADINEFKEKHKAFLMKCAAVYMFVKVGFILIATFTTVAFLVISASQYLAIEMSKTKALIFAVPLTLIVILKLYFIIKMLMTYEKSRAIINFVFNTMILNGKEGIRRIGKTIPSGLPPLSPEKIKNR